MQFKYNDGGRFAAGFKGNTGDCVCRSIAIVTGLPYIQVYNTLNSLGSLERANKKKAGKRSNARTGIFKETIKIYLKSLGYTWSPTMFVGKGCQVHLRAEELPTGRLIVSVSRHLVAVIDGVINDTHDCSRGGMRCVYGYWIKS